MVLNLFPTAEPYLFNEHGYQIAQLIPAIAATISTIAGDYSPSGPASGADPVWIGPGRPARRARRSDPGGSPCPIVKSI